MIETSKIGKIHFWKVSGVVNKEEYSRASNELLELFKSGKVEVCIAEVGDIESYGPHKELLKWIDTYEKYVDIPTIVYGIHSFLRIIVNVLARVNPAFSRNFIIMQDKESAWKLARDLTEDK